MLSTLSTVRWSDFSQPPWNHQDTIPSVLRQLADLHDTERSNQVYNAVLFALGNNHRGTLWPVAIAMIPFLVEILEHGPAAAAACAAEILHNVLLFYPDDGFDTMLKPDGTPVPLRDAILDEVVRFRPQMEQIRRSRQQCAALTEPLSDLFGHLDERSSATEGS